MTCDHLHSFSAKELAEVNSMCEPKTNGFSNAPLTTTTNTQAENDKAAGMKTYGKPKPIFSDQNNNELANKVVEAELEEAATVLGNFLFLHHSCST